MIRGRTLLDLLLPLFLVLPAFAQSPDSDKGTVAQPTWSVGDWWDFRDGRAAWRLTVIAREGADYVLVKTAAKEPATSPDGKEKYLVSPNGVTQKIIARVACTSKTRTGDGYASYAHTAWYAPDAKRLVRLESDYAGGPSIEVTAWSVQP